MKGLRANAAIQMTAGLVPGDAAAHRKAAWAVRARSALAPVGTLALRAWLAQEFIPGGMDQMAGRADAAGMVRAAVLPRARSRGCRRRRMAQRDGPGAAAGDGLALGRGTRWAAAA